MANANIVRGFVPVRHANGQPYNGNMNRYYKDTTAGILGVGDPVIAVTASSDPNGGAEIVRADTPGQAITGVIVGFGPDVTNLHKSGYMLAADVGYVWVCDDPSVWYEVQEGGAATALAVTNVKNYINWVTAADANTTLGLSKFQLDNNTVGTSTGTFRIERLVDRPDNAVGQYAKWLVSVALSTEVNKSALNLSAV